MAKKRRPQVTTAPATSQPTSTSKPIKPKRKPRKVNPDNLPDPPVYA